MRILLIILATPLAFTALFFGALLGSRAAVREAIARGLIANTCRNCGAMLRPGPPTTTIVPARRSPAAGQTPTPGVRAPSA